jgi:hypothetical protein
MTESKALLLLNATLKTVYDAFQADPLPVRIKDFHVQDNETPLAMRACDLNWLQTIPELQHLQLDQEHLSCGQNSYWTQLSLAVAPHVDNLGLTLVYCHSGTGTVYHDPVRNRWQETYLVPGKFMVFDDRKQHSAFPDSRMTLLLACFVFK